eukprot:m.266334 g.266334  ORF g.266334 m.266334 type:complete len:548 (+) comp30550_c0_seq1:67-1710(+)
MWIIACCILVAAGLEVDDYTPHHSNQLLTVSWTEQEARAAQPFPVLGVFTDDAPDTHPLLSLSVDQATHSIDLPLPNIRQPLHFRLFSSSINLTQHLEDYEHNETISRRETQHVFSGLRLISASLPVNFMNAATEPLQRHLHLVSDQQDSDVAITWVTGNVTNPRVRFGQSISNLSHTAGAQTVTYTAAMLCGPPANEPENFIDPGLIHTAVMAPLSSGEWFYTVGSDEGPWSPVTKFHVGYAKDLPYHFVVYGDLGVSPYQSTANTTIELVKESNPSFVVHIGDISYARGHAFKWELFYTQIERVAASVVYEMGIGNHDFDYKQQPFKPWWGTYGEDSGGECGVPYRARFLPPTADTSPKRLTADNSTHYYSFEQGPDGTCVHFVVMDTEADYLSGSPQREWIARDLANVDRQRCPWLIFSAHRPFYDTTFDNLLPELAQMRNSIEPLLVEYKVDLVMVGHIHQYERTCNVINSKCDKKGPVHTTVGMAGAEFQPPFDNKPEWLVNRSYEHGFSRLMVANATAMRMQFVTVHNEIEDEFWLYHESE